VEEPAWALVREMILRGFDHAHASLVCLIVRRGTLAQIAKMPRPGRGDGLLRFERGLSGGSEAVACAAGPVLVAEEPGEAYREAGAVNHG
jgi:hypothetical protein